MGVKRTTVPAVVLVMAMFLALSCPMAADAALPAPGFLPGQPMLVGNQVLIMWLPVPGAAKYNVYLNGKKISEVPTNQHMVPVPEQAGEYAFVVAGVDAAGTEGAKSAPGIVRVMKLDAPKDFFTRVNDKDKVVALRWNVPAGAVIFDIYRAVGKPENFQMLSSVQGDQYQDTKVEIGKKYFYQVVAKDLGGKASPPSKPVEVEVKQVVERVAKKFTFKAAVTKPVNAILFIDEKEINQVGKMKMNRKTGEVWLCETTHKTLYQMNAKGDVVKKLGPFPTLNTPNKFDFGPDGKLYLSDALGGKLVCIDPATGSIVWESPVTRPPKDDKALWEGLPASYRESRPVSGDVLCLDKEIWVTDQRWAVVCVFDYQGKQLRYFYRYTEAGKPARIPGVGEIVALSGDRYVFTYPMSHLMAVMDKDMNLLFEIGKASTGWIGAFLGIAGVSETADGNILVTDPGFSSIQLFDGKTGDYIQHYGTTGEEDKEQPGRAKVDFSNPSYAFVDRDGNLWFFAGNEKTIFIRKPASK